MDGLRKLGCDPGPIDEFIVCLGLCGHIKYRRAASNPARSRRL